MCVFVQVQRFAAVIMRIRDPRTTALVFSSGKMVCTGAKRYRRKRFIVSPYCCVCVCLHVCALSEDLSRLAARKYARIIQKLGFPVCVHVHTGVLIVFLDSAHLVTTGKIYGIQSPKHGR